MSRIIITIPDPLLKEIDREAKQDHRSRAELVRDALRVYLDRKRAEEEEQAKRRRAAELMDELRKETIGKGIKASEVIKKWRYRLAK